MVCLRSKIRAFVSLSLTSSELYTIYDNLSSLSTRAGDFIHRITDEGQLIYNNSPRLYEFLSNLEHSHPKQVPVVFKVSGLMDSYVKELKNNVQCILFSAYSIYCNLLSGIVYLYRCGGEGLGGNVTGLLLMAKFIGLLLWEFLKFFKPVGSIIWELVRHVRSMGLFIRKQLLLYNVEVIFIYLLLVLS